MTGHFNPQIRPSFSPYTPAGIWCSICSPFSAELGDAEIFTFPLAKNADCSNTGVVFELFKPNYANHKPNGWLRRTARPSRRLGPRGKKPGRIHPRTHRLAAILVRCVRAGQTGNRRLRNRVCSLFGERLAQVRSLGFVFNQLAFPKNSLPCGDGCFLFL